MHIDNLYQHVFEITDLQIADRQKFEQLSDGLAKADDGAVFIYLSPEIPDGEFIDLLLKAVNKKRKDFEEADLGGDIYKPREDDFEGQVPAILEACRVWIGSNLKKADVTQLATKLFVLDLTGTSTGFVCAHLALSNTFRNTMLSGRGPLVFLLPPSGDWDQLRKITNILFSDLRSSLSGEYRFGTHYQQSH